MGGQGHPQAHSRALTPSMFLDWFCPWAEQELQLWREFQLENGKMQWEVLMQDVVSMKLDCLKLYPAAMAESEVS